VQHEPAGSEAGSKDENMKIYVGNLPFEARDEELRELFAGFGNVASSKVIIDNTSGRSRGFGFVEFEDQAEARAAIAAVHGKEFGGRSLVVNEARSQGGFGGDRGSHGGGWGGRGGNDRSGGFRGGRRS
jgi:RNA recognition motif-containing protein